MGAEVLGQSRHAGAPPEAHAAVSRVVDDELVPFAAGHIEREGEFVIGEAVGHADTESGGEHILELAFLPRAEGHIGSGNPHLDVAGVVDVGRELRVIDGAELEPFRRAVEHADGDVGAVEVLVVLLFDLGDPGGGEDAAVGAHDNAVFLAHLPFVVRQQVLGPEIDRDAHGQAVGEFEAEGGGDGAERAALAVVDLAADLLRAAEAAARGDVAVAEVEVAVEIVLALVIEAEDEIAPGESAPDRVDEAEVV